MPKANKWSFAALIASLLRSAHAGYSPDWEDRKYMESMHEWIRTGRLLWIQVRLEALDKNERWQPNWTDNHFWGERHRPLNFAIREGQEEIVAYLIRYMITNPKSREKMGVEEIDRSIDYAGQHNSKMVPFLRRLKSTIREELAAKPSPSQSSLIKVSPSQTVFARAIAVGGIEERQEQANRLALGAAGLIAAATQIAAAASASPSSPLISGSEPTPLLRRSPEPVSPTAAVSFGVDLQGFLFLVLLLSLILNYKLGQAHGRARQDREHGGNGLHRD